MWRAQVVGWLGLLIAGCGRVAFEPGSDAPGDEGSAPAFQRLCTFARVTVIENGLSVDDTVGAALSSSLASGCHGTPIARTVSQDGAGVLDPATGRPLLAADDLAIIGGGDGPNQAIAYLLRADTPVSWSGSSTVTFVERATGHTIVTAPASSSHDFALIMVVAEPIGGGRILSASGMTGNGTRAAGYWFTNRIAPTIATNPQVWTLVEWTNVDADPGPSAGDTFVVVAGG